MTLARSAAEAGLSWNVTAPCRLEAELWLCKREAAGGECEEVTGSRRTLHSPGAWGPTQGGHVVGAQHNTTLQGCVLSLTPWLLCAAQSQVGEFAAAAAHPLLCLQVKAPQREARLP